MEIVDLKTLSVRESDQVEWKENVADIDDVVATLAAFANDWSNLGGGYVVCGAREEKDEFGFPRVVMTGLTASRVREVEGKVLAACRDRVSPSIAPLLQELPVADSPERRVLVFVMPSTRSPHLFRRRDAAGKYYVRISRETIDARNGILRELLVRKGAVEEWDRRACATANVHDIDLLALREALHRMRVFNPDGVDDYLSDNRSLSPMVPPLCVREPLTGILRPRNFAMLLFGRETQLHIPGSYSLFSIYPGSDRSESHAERHELTGPLIEQARRLEELLGAQSNTVFDKTNRKHPNAFKDPVPALHEAMINVLSHRNYEVPDPARFTVFSDRIEVLSPGSLPTGVSPDEFREGRAAPKWRNQSLAWLLNRLQLAQAEGQGIPTILRSMREEGCPPPEFQMNEARVVCTLRANPRYLRLAAARAAVDSRSSKDPFRNRSLGKRGLDILEVLWNHQRQHGSSGISLEAIDRILQKRTPGQAAPAKAGSLAPLRRAIRHLRSWPAPILIVGIGRNEDGGPGPARQVYSIDPSNLITWPSTAKMAVHVFSNTAVQRNLTVLRGSRFVNDSTGLPATPEELESQVAFCLRTGYFSAREASLVATPRVLAELPFLLFVAGVVGDSMPKVPPVAGISPA
jgi:ATP-dependent DNA helicase RecG